MPLAEVRGITLVMGVGVDWEGVAPQWTAQTDAVKLMTSVMIK